MAVRVMQKTQIPPRFQRLCDAVHTSSAGALPKANDDQGAIESVVDAAIAGGDIAAAAGSAMCLDGYREIPLKDWYFGTLQRIVRIAYNHAKTLDGSIREKQDERQRLLDLLNGRQ